VIVNGTEGLPEPKMKPSGTRMFTGSNQHRQFCSEGCSTNFPYHRTIRRRGATL